MNDALLIVLICAIVTIASRAIPFLLFPEDKVTPKMILYISDKLPVAMIGMLIVYCLKDVSLEGVNHGIPEVLSILIVIFLHLVKKKDILSIVGGTAFYMILVQVIF